MLYFLQAQNVEFQSMHIFHEILSSHKTYFLTHDFNLLGVTRENAKSTGSSKRHVNIELRLLSTKRLKWSELFVEISQNLADLT